MGIVLMCLACAAGGCTTRAATQTPRTAVEQLLLSTAVDRAMEKFHMPEVTGQRVFVDFTHLNAYDADYIRLAVLTAFSRQNAMVVRSPDDADLVAYVASGGVGTEYRTALLGIPAIPVALPNMPLALPEVPFYKAIDQTGLAKLAILIQTRQGQFVASGEYWAKADRFESTLLWYRFMRRDDIVQAWMEADLRLEERQDMLVPPSAP